MTLYLLLSFLVSIAVHLALVLFGPDIRPPAVAFMAPPIQVDLVRREVPLPEVLRPKLPPPVPLPKSLDLPKLIKETPLILPKPTLSAKPSLAGSETVPKGRAATSPPSLRIPGSVTKPEDLALPKPPQEDGSGGASIFAISVGTPGESKGLGGKKKAISEEGAESHIAEELSRLKSDFLNRPFRNAPIAGPAGRRKILFKPPHPRIAMASPGQRKEDVLEGSEHIVLRFWVLPDGTVGTVIPERKGNARLEGICTKHLKQWRLIPLAQYILQKEVWGLVPCRTRGP